MKRRIKILASLLTVLFVQLPIISYAHGLVQDSSGQVDSVLHILPDDEPVVGTTTVFHYDFEKSFDVEGASAKFVIAQKSGNVEAEIPAAITQNAAAATYIFKESGEYKLTLSVITADKHNYTFEISEEIAKSSKDVEPSIVTPIWLVGAMVGLIIAALIALLLTYKKRSST